MKTSAIVTVVIVFLLAGVSLIFSVLHFWQKGVLLNNDYLYLSDEERKNKDKKPYYRQSAVVFFIIFLVFLSLGLNLLTKKVLFLIIEFCCIAALMVYGIVSSVLMKKAERKNNSV